MNRTVARENCSVAVLLLLLTTVCGLLIRMFTRWRSHAAFVVRLLLPGLQQGCHRLCTHGSQPPPPACIFSRVHASCSSPAGAAAMVRWCSPDCHGMHEPWKSSLPWQASPQEPKTPARDSPPLGSCLGRQCCSCFERTCLRVTVAPHYHGKRKPRCPNAGAPTCIFRRVNKSCSSPAAVSPPVATSVAPSACPVCNSSAPATAASAAAAAAAVAVSADPILLAELLPVPGSATAAAAAGFSSCTSEGSGELSRPC
jgi:hypothetical protein